VCKLTNFWEKRATIKQIWIKIVLYEDPLWLVDSSWNVMAHGYAREGKWRENWRMQWVASTLHTTSEHGVSSITTADGTRWRTVGKVKGKLASGVGSQYPSHYLGTWCIQHYYRWCAHLGCQESTELTPPADLNGLVRFAERRNLVSVRVPSHFIWPLTTFERFLNCRISHQD